MEEVRYFIGQKEVFATFEEGSDRCIIRVGSNYFDIETQLLNLIAKTAESHLKSIAETIEFLKEYSDCQKK